MFAPTTNVVNHAMLSSGFTSFSQTSGMPAASISQSGVNVRSRITAPDSTRARIRNSVGGSSETRESVWLIDTPPPPSRRHWPQQLPADEIVS